MLARQMPIWKNGVAIGFIDLALERAYVYREHALSEVVAIPSGDAAQEKEQRYSMLERLADYDDELMEELISDIEPPRDQVFDDLAKIGDRDMQKLLSEIDKADLALALKAAPPELSQKLLANLSSRARDNIKEEMEMLGPRPLSDVEEAQKRILQQVRAMEERGDIRINRGAGEVMV